MEVQCHNCGRPYFCETHVFQGLCPDCEQPPNPGLMSENMRTMRIKLMQGYHQDFRCVACGKIFNSKNTGLVIRVFPCEGGDVVIGVCSSCITGGFICCEAVIDESRKTWRPEFYVARKEEEE